MRRGSHIDPTSARYLPRTTWCLKIDSAVPVQTLVQNETQIQKDIAPTNRSRTNLPLEHIPGKQTCHALSHLRTKQPYINSVRETKSSSTRTHFSTGLDFTSSSDKHANAGRKLQTAKPMSFVSIPPPRHQKVYCQVALASQLKGFEIMQFQVLEVLEVLLLLY